MSIDAARPGSARISIVSKVGFAPGSVRGDDDGQRARRARGDESGRIHAALETRASAEAESERHAGNHAVLIVACFADSRSVSPRSSCVWQA
jgi:hypothetical protein